MKSTLKTVVYAMGAMLAASSFISSHGAVSVTASRTYVVQETTLHASETAGQNVLIYTLGSQSNKFVVAKDGLDRATRLTPVTELGTTNVIGYYIGTNVNARVASSDWMSKVSGLNPVYGDGEYSESVIGYTLGNDTGKVVASADWLSNVTEVKPIISSDDSPPRVVGYTIGTNAYVFASDKSVEVQQVKKVMGSTTNVVGYTIGGNTNNVFMSEYGVRNVIPNYEAVSNAAMRVMSQISDGSNVVDAARNVYRVSHNSWFMYKYMTMEYSVPHELYYQGNVAYSNIVNGSIGTIEDFYVSNRRFASKATIRGDEVVGDVFIGVEGSTTNVVITHARRSDGVYPIIWSYPSSVSNGVIYAFNNGNTECDIRRLTDEEVSTNFVGRLALTNDVVTLVKPGLITDGTNTIYASRKFVAESGEFEWRVTVGQSGTSHVLVGQKNQAQYVPDNPQEGDEMWTIYFLPYEYGSENGWWMFYVDRYSGGDWASDVFYQAEGNIDDTMVNISLGTYVAEWVSSDVVVGKIALMSDFSTSNELLVATIESVSPKRDSDRITDGTNIIDAAGCVWEVGAPAWISTTAGVEFIQWTEITYGEYEGMWDLSFSANGDGSHVYTNAPSLHQSITVPAGAWWYHSEMEDRGDFPVSFVLVATTNLVGRVALTNDILVTPTKTSQLTNDGSNGVPFAVVSQIPPAPGNYAAVSNAAMNARSMTDLGVRGAPSGVGSWFVVDGIRFDLDADNFWRSGDVLITVAGDGYYTITGPAIDASFHLDSAFTSEVEGHIIIGYTNTLAQVSQMPDVPSASEATPLMDGTASAGTTNAWARGDHVHPSDTSKLDGAAVYSEWKTNRAYVGRAVVSYKGRLWLTQFGKVPLLGETTPPPDKDTNVWVEVCLKDIMQETLPYPTNAIPYAAISGEPSLAGQTYDFSRNYDIIKATADIVQLLGGTVTNNPTAQGGN